MNEDRSSLPQGQTNSDDKNGRTWLTRLAQLLQTEPKDRDQLVEILREAHANDLIDVDALGMLEGVLQVSEMQVRDIMIPRSQMTVLERDMSMQEVLPIVVDSAHSR